MRRRKLLVVLAGLAVLALGGFVLWPQTDRVTRENFGHIKEGMSRAEVEAILGPPGDYRSGPTNLAILGTRSCVSFSDDGEILKIPLTMWHTDTALVTVAFGPSGVVECKDWDTDFRLEQSTTDNLVWRAKHQWRRWFP
jgi:hypothetical protein